MLSEDISLQTAVRHRCTSLLVEGRGLTTDILLIFFGSDESPFLSFSSMLFIAALSKLVAQALGDWFEGLGIRAGENVVLVVSWNSECHIVTHVTTACPAAHLSCTFRTSSDDSLSDV